MSSLKRPKGRPKGSKNKAYQSEAKAIGLPYFRTNHNHISVPQMLKNLKRKYPDLFALVTTKDIWNWAVSDKKKHNKMNGKNYAMDEIDESEYDEEDDKINEQYQEDWDQNNEQYREDWEDHNHNHNQKHNEYNHNSSLECERLKKEIINLKKENTSLKTRMALMENEIIKFNKFAAKFKKNIENTSLVPLCSDDDL